MLRPAPYGPPDEADLLRKTGGSEGSPFVSHLSNPQQREPVRLDGATGPGDPRSADITVQPLRAGLSLKVAIENQDPAVGTVTSLVIIAGGSEQGDAGFKPLGVGSTVKHSTTVNVVVKE